jgi:hypothetical protein
MGVPSTILRASTSLRLGERVVVRCVDGALGAEYALFDPGEIVLRASDPVTVREMGYITTARQALLRLARLGVTPDLATEAARALSANVVASYARGQVVRALAGRLGPQEIFDGTIYRAGTQSYEGSWLHLPPLSATLGREAAWALQALHLAAVLNEVTANTPLQLATANLTRTSRSGERTFRRVTFESARDLPARLREVGPHVPGPDLEPQGEEALRETLLARVRERISTDTPPPLRAHLEALEGALAAGGLPPSRMSHPELRAIEQQLATGDARGIPERIEELERMHGRTPALRYLRARAAFVRGDEPPAKIAQALSAITEEEPNFHEAQLVAARAWLAAGEDAHARFFARRLADDASAGESARLVALEILEETARTNRSNAPPPVKEKGRKSDPVAPPGALAPVRAVRGAPKGASLPPTASTIPPPPAAGWPESPPAEVPPPPRVPSGGGAAAGRKRPSGKPSRAAQPPLNTDAPKNVPPPRYDAELVETLALPLGASEDALGMGQAPTTPDQARVAMTRLARTLGRDYRLWYGSTLRCNVIAVDLMQRHLSQRYAGASLADAKTTSELLRHGALLSEIIARALGGAWVDVAPTECGYWAMVIPPATRCFPIGRVYRFVALGHRERDLVAYYLDLEKRAREPGGG